MSGTTHSTHLAESAALLRPRRNLNSGNYKLWFREIRAKSGKSLNLRRPGMSFVIIKRKIKPENDSPCNLTLEGKGS